ncbi:BsuBI/PstI family type II restriction endonuclease [Paenibacillus qinlingensis]|uniref:BsuBI/PstI family type II restriction endonuclease n=1 Tax=Paenibacillus qinlingensis TaxID=1837343 RepID=UPI0015660567|nr:BsuBI/PstI family type II restriction endonuclease [Paenibacillus qinlingensis]NQX63749.1 restriction endonuclease [Paenibacillus qinlingensis]
MDWFETSLPEVEIIKERLQLLIPENVEDAIYSRNIVAARTVFVMLYAFAIEGYGIEVRPSTITVMNDEQATKLLRSERMDWVNIMQRPKKPSVEGRWYSENTRESIRDDTIATLKQLGAVGELEGLPPTSSKPRYFLARDFAELMNPKLIGDELEEEISNWREKHLHKGALILQGLRELERQSVITVELGGFRHSLPSGLSSVLSKEAVETFARNFLVKPEVLLISDSKVKFHPQFSKLFGNIGLSLDPKKTLPDLIIAETAENRFKLVFIEIVHTDGPISGARMRELLDLARESFPFINPDDCAFVTVFASRSDSAYRKVQGSLAWGSFVWFADEPNRIIHLIDTDSAHKVTLHDLLKV